MGNVAVNTILVKRPLFIGRYYIYGGKKYLFTHRHPYKQEYWSDDVPDPKYPKHYGAWISTEKLTEPAVFNSGSGKMKELRSKDI